MALRAGGAAIRPRSGWFAILFLVFCCAPAAGLRRMGVHSDGPDDSPLCSLPMLMPLSAFSFFLSVLSLLSFCPFSSFFLSFLLFLSVLSLLAPRPAPCIGGSRVAVRVYERLDPAPLCSSPTPLRSCRWAKSPLSPPHFRSVVRHASCVTRPASPMRGNARRCDACTSAGVRASVRTGGRA